jgi:taurine transport system permease protein
MVAASSGIGWMVVDAGNWFRNDIIFVGIFVMGFTGLFIDWLLKFLEKKLVPWSGKD